jgi:hypothetical protein
MIAGVFGVLAILTVLVAAPLVLGTYVVVQQASSRLALVWLGFLTLLCIATLGAGGLALLLALF